jgi:hypothetical protein
LICRQKVTEIFFYIFPRTDIHLMLLLYILESFQLPTQSNFCLRIPMLFHKYNFLWMLFFLFIPTLFSHLCCLPWYINIYIIVIIKTCKREREREKRENFLSLFNSNSPAETKTKTHSHYITNNNNLINFFEVKFGI